MSESPSFLMTQPDMTTRARTLNRAAARGGNTGPLRGQLTILIVKK